VVRNRGVKEDDMTARRSRREALQLIAGGALLAGAAKRLVCLPASAQTGPAPAAPFILMDGYVHVTNRIY
jgi:hypothetical protein